MLIGLLGPAESPGQQDQPPTIPFSPSPRLGEPWTDAPIFPQGVSSMLPGFQGYGTLRDGIEQYGDESLAEIVRVSINGIKAVPEIVESLAKVIGIQIKGYVGGQAR